VGVKALDARTLQFKLAYPVSYFPELQISPGFLPVHQAAIEPFGAMDQRGTKWTQPGNLVGNGPFRLVEWRPNEYIKVVRNEHYWDRDHVRLDGIQIFPVSDILTEERLFRSGKLDMTGNVPLHKIQVYKKEHPELLHIDPFGAVGFYMFNVDRKPFDDKRVRQAFSLAVDRKELTENVLQGDEPPAYHLVPPGVRNYTSDDILTFDPDRARALLADAGYPDGAGFPDTELLYNSSEEHRMLAEAIQQMWKKNLNVDIRLYNQDWKVYIDSLKKQDYAIARAAWVEGVMDPMYYLELGLSGGVANRCGYASPAFDALIEQARHEADMEKRAALMRQAENILLEDVPLMPLFFYTRKYLMDPAVKGYTPNAEGYIPFKDMYLERGAEGNRQAS